MRSIRIHLLARPIHKAASGGRFLLLTFLFLSFILAVKAQSGFVGRIVLNIDDPAKPVAFEEIYPESLYIGLRFQVSSFSPSGLWLVRLGDKPTEKISVP
ncbi:hypothetical protein [Parabacteroides sp.]